MLFEIPSLSLTVGMELHTSCTSMLWISNKFDFLWDIVFLSSTSLENVVDSTVRNIVRSERVFCITAALLFFADLQSYLHFLFLSLVYRITAKLSESNPDEVDKFKNNMNKQMKDILTRFKELQFFTGESMDCDGMIALCEYREIDGKQLPVFMFFKHGLEEEKF